jgi:hypothetical protein
MITEDGVRTSYYEWFSIPKNAGGNDKSFIDRLKIRIIVKLLFNTITINFDEGRAITSVIAYKRGPVRVNKRIEHIVLLPGGIRALRAVSDAIQYRATATVPAIFQVPFRMDRIVSSLIVQSGTDYNRNAFGARVINSNNPQGFLVDGRMGYDELNNFNPELDEWRLITGDCGTFMTRTLFPDPEGRKHVTGSMGYIDDVSQAYPPESVPGTIGYLYQEWDLGKVPRGTFYAFLEFYWVPNYKPGDELKYTKYMDDPLKIQAGVQERTSQVMFYVTDLSRRYE